MDVDYEARNVYGVSKFFKEDVSKYCFFYFTGLSIRKPITVFIMALLVMEFSRQGYKIGKVFA